MDGGRVLHTFPAQSGAAPRCSSSRTTSRLPYLEATWSGVKPFCRDEHKQSALHPRRDTGAPLGDLGTCICAPGSTHLDLTCVGTPPSTHLY